MSQEIVIPLIHIGTLSNYTQHVGYAEQGQLVTLVEVTTGQDGRSTILRRTYTGGEQTESSAVNVPTNNIAVSQTPEGPVLQIQLP